jgi:cation diffusion facilitator family transporter
MVSAAWHLIMAIVKAGYGWKIHSVGMIADGFHSGIHASGVLFALGGIYLASRPPDAGHPYGYERYEPLTAMGLGGLMIAAMLVAANTAIEHTHANEALAIDAGSFAVMALSIVGTGILGLWERRGALALSSTVLQADARRSWTAGLVSLSVVIGLVLGMVGLQAADPMVAFAVVAAIAWTAWRTIREASRILTDATAADVRQIAAIAKSVPGVLGCHEVRARGVAGRVRIDLHVTVDPQMTVTRAHEISGDVERRVQERIEGVAEVLVHIGAASFHSH